MKYSNVNYANTSIAKMDVEGSVCSVGSVNNAESAEIAKISQLNNEQLAEFGHWLQTWWPAFVVVLAGLSPTFTSGYPPVEGEKYKSDTDVNVLVANVEALYRIYTYLRNCYSPGELKDHCDKGYITLRLPGRRIRIEIRFTIYEKEFLQTQKHSYNERMIGTMFPHLAVDVAKLKLLEDGSKGLSTEKAWAKVLGYTNYNSNDAYDYMAGPLHVLIDAAKK